MYDHGVATTGVHGAGANTILYSNHNVQLKTSIHPNTTFCRYYMSSDQDDIPAALNYARIELNTSNFDLGSNFQTGKYYNQEQADANNCTATNIRDTSVNFQTITGQTNGLKNCRVTWSSDWNGTLNTGKGYVTAVVDASNLTIQKTTGDNFANNYYYTITKAAYKVPVAGYYFIGVSMTWHGGTIVADKFYLPIISKNEVNIQAAYFHSSHNYSGLTTFTSGIFLLSVNDLISVGVYNGSGATQTIFGSTVDTYLLTYLIMAT
jgi:hypothetical protein